MDERLLIKNTTKEEREKIVLGGLGLDGACEGCSGCDGVGMGDPLEIYKAYIDGEKELWEVTASFNRGGSIK